MRFEGRSIFIIFIIGVLFQLSAFSQEKQSQVYYKAVYSLPLTLDPIKMNDTASLTVGNLIYDGLLRFNSILEVEPAISESWSISKDGKVISFKLMDNAYFHSGEIISAADVKASLKRALSKKSKVRNLYSSISSIIVKNQKNLDIVLKYPFPPILSILAGSTAKVLPAKNMNQKDFFKNPIGSGAFKYEFLDEKNKEIVLSGFTKYFSGQPAIQKMILKETSESEAVNMAKIEKFHDLASWPLTQANEVFSFGQKISSPVASTWIIGLNSKFKPFSDLSVRQLFKIQFPAEKFRLKFYPDAIAAKGYVPNGLVGSDIGFNFKINNSKPPLIKIVMVIPQELEKAKEIKSFIENEMKFFGWNLDVKLLPWTDLMKGYSNKTLSSFLVSMNMDYPDADFLLKNFESTNPDNFSGLKNSEVDQLLNQSRSSQDRKEREIYYKKALSIIEDSAVTVNLFHPRANYWVSNCVEDFEPNMLSEVYINYNKIKLKQDCHLKKDQ